MSTNATSTPAKKKRKMSKWILLGLGGAAIWALTGAKRAGSDDPILWNPEAMQPVDIPKGTVSVNGHYRVITNRRDGMTYDLVQQGTPPGELFFTASKAGKFTRNFLSEGGKLYAEIL